MTALTERLQDNNPFVLTAINRRLFILRKDNLEYEPKKNDRILSVDCVLANSERLVEVERGVFEFLA